MTYVMSDIHGHYDKYREMLETIEFAADDTLYVLGIRRVQDPVGHGGAAQRDRASGKP